MPPRNPSARGYAVYLKLVPQLTLTDANQSLVAEITCVRLLEELVFLPVLLDSCSPRSIGWALHHSLHAELTPAALRTALRQ